MPEFLPPTSPLVLAAAISVAVGASFLGVFMILRRMALVADAFSHVALPGIALGLLFGVSPSLGGLLMLILGVLLIVRLETRHNIAPETALGVIFMVALAVGLLLIPEEHLLESLFGDITKLTRSSALLSLCGGILVTIATWLLARKFALLTLSAELAHASGIALERTRLLFFLIIAIAVALGIQFMGVLLMGAVLVLPAAIAKNFTPNLRIMFLGASTVSVLSMIGGLVFAERFEVLPGPAVVITLVAIFILSLFTRRRT
ncbi:MAG: metal ABC transporter permease [bacterium]|nr:metal ABC transporter permease [bacterium]